jgi:hypothetical protein
MLALNLDSNSQEKKNERKCQKNDTQQKWRSNLLLTNNPPLQLGTCTPIPIPSEEKQRMRDNRLNTHFCATNGRILSFDIYGA